MECLILVLYSKIYKRSVSELLGAMSYSEYNIIYLWF